MKLSVIVPAYNLEKYITPCLESLLTQQCAFDYEVWVCNDASTDGTGQVIAQVKQRYPKLNVLTNPVNLGLVASMARLLDASSGQYIAYLDGDDLALPGKLAALVSYLDEHPQCAIAYHEAEMFDSDTDRTLKLYCHDFYNAEHIPQQATIEHLVRYGTFIKSSGIAFRRHDYLLRALEHGCSIVSDYPWHIMNAGYIGGTIDRIDHILGRYRVHSNSFSAQTSRDATLRLQVTKELAMACQLGRRFGLNDAVIDAGIAHVQFSAALYFLRQGDDQHFSEMIEASADHRAFFDDRHRQALAWRNRPQQVRQMLGWAS